jgi:hypothetical protein
MFFKNSKNTSLLKESLEKTHETELTQDQALEAEHNFMGFFELLYQIDQRNQNQEKTSNDNKNKRSAN